MYSFWVWAQTIWWESARTTKAVSKIYNIWSSHICSLLQICLVSHGRINWQQSIRHWAGQLQWEQRLGDGIFTMQQSSLDQSTAMYTLLWVRFNCHDGQSYICSWSECSDDVIHITVMIVLWYLRPWQSPGSHPNHGALARPQCRSGWP